MKKQLAEAPDSVTGPAPYPYGTPWGGNDENDNPKTPMMPWSESESRRSGAGGLCAFCLLAHMQCNSPFLVSIPPQERRT